MESIARQDKFKAWLQMLRLPEMITVPAATATGFMLAEGSSEGALDLVFVCLAALCAFAAASVANDIADAGIDPKTRPLPSGKVNETHARITASYLAFFALVFAAFAGFASFFTCAVILVVCGFYNFHRGVREWAGSELLAFTSAANLLLGASAVPGMNWKGFSPEMVAAAAIFVYYFGVAIVLKEPYRPLHDRHGRKRFLTGAISCAVLAIIIAALHAKILPILISCFCAALLLMGAYGIFKALNHNLEVKALEEIGWRMHGFSLFALAAFCASQDDGYMIWPISLIMLERIHNFISLKLMDT